MTDLDRLMASHEVEAIVGVGRTTLWKWEKDGAFPKSVRVGRQRKAWRESDIRVWLATLPKGG